MQRQTQPLDYRTAARVDRVRPRFWLWHMVAAAVLCLVALLVDFQLWYAWVSMRRVAQAEFALAAYGAACAIVSVVRGSLTKADKVAVAACLLLFAFSACVGSFLPRAIHD